MSVSIAGVEKAAWGTPELDVLALNSSTAERAESGDTTERVAMSYGTSITTGRF
ncbi:MAG: hypothetical protein ACTH30_00870 [Leucobacter sp.]